MPSSRVHWLKTDDLSTILEPAKPGANIAGTKALVTLGPASRDVDTLVKLLEAGVTCVRVDLTYGSVDYHKQSLKNLQTAVRQTRRLCATVLDTFGRELVIRRKYEVNEQGWPKPQGILEVKKGQEMLVVTDDKAMAHDNVLPIEHPNFDTMCFPGDTLFVGRYLTNGADKSSVYLDVVKVEKGVVTCKAQNDAVLDGLLTVIHSDVSSNGMSAAQTGMDLLTHRDRRAIEDISKQFDIDFVALTYTSSAADVVHLRQFLQSINQASTKIIAKVENQQALENFEEIAGEADAVLLSRGNLGLDVPPEKVAIVQKEAINRCNMLGKPVIITRVVDTMTQAPRCTRAEATDIANAVLDGVDGILLGAETLRGSYPVEAVTTVLGICREAEQVFNYKGHFEFLMRSALELQEQGVSIDSRDESGAASPVVGEDQSYSLADEKNYLKTIGSSSSQKPPRAPGSLPGGLTRASSGISLARAINRALPYSSVRDTPNLSKAEAMASTAVRAADKVQSKLIVVFASSGKTAALVAKYRPPMPIMCLVVPRLTSNSLSWTVEGRGLARQLLLLRGVIPVLSVPNIESGSNEWILQSALALAAKKKLVGVEDHVVCLMAVKDHLALKIVSMDTDRGEVCGKKGSHHDLAAMATRASLPDQSGPYKPQPSPYESQQQWPSSSSVTAPEINIIPKTEVPHIKLEKDQDHGEKQETTQNT